MSRFGNNQICGHCNKTKSKNLTSNNKKLKIANCCCSCKFLIDRELENTFGATFHKILIKNF